jgi:hypothetical protein
MARPGGRLPAADRLDVAFTWSRRPAPSTAGADHRLRRFAERATDRIPTIRRFLIQRLRLPAAAHPGRRLDAL